LEKSRKIVRCNVFAHTACGERAGRRYRAAHYYGAWGENLYLGEGRLGAPRVALDGWLNSPHHRENLFNSKLALRGDSGDDGRQVGEYSNVTIWVNQFGED